MNARLKKNMILFLLALIFIAPGILAVFFYNNPHWITSVSNKGELHKTPYQIPFDNPQKKWSIVAWYPKDCDAQCFNKIDELHRVRLALGRYFYQVNCILLQKEGATSLERPFTLALKENQIHVIALNSKEIPASLSSERPQLLLVDPEQWVVLTYNTHINPMDVLFDMKRLLKQKTNAAF